jgi:hypothetical protein
MSEHDEKITRGDLAFQAQKLRRRGLFLHLCDDSHCSSEPSSTDPRVDIPQWMQVDFDLNLPFFVAVELASKVLVGEHGSREVYQLSIANQILRLELMGTAGGADGPYLEAQQ